MSKIKVKFIKASSGIEAGTVKNLPKNTADACIKLGVAELVKAPVKKKAPSKKASDKK